MNTPMPLAPEEFWESIAEAGDLSPYLRFTADEWADFRADTPLTLTAREIDRLRSLNDPVSIDEVRHIYLSLSRLLSEHVEANQTLHRRRSHFLSLNGHKTPFIIGVAGSVAVGKSTTARLIEQLMARWPHSPKVDLVTTDGFLLPNAELESRGIMHRKGFPESYDIGAILRFLGQVKAGQRRVEAPLYSHLSYDVLDGEVQIVDWPDILIFEGINVLQSRELPPEGKSIPFVSDFFDFSIYIDADEHDIRHWYIERFMRLRETAFMDPASYFHRYASMDDEAARDYANHLWDDINRVNLVNNIQPTRPRADIVLKKGRTHRIEQVALRKI